MSGFNFKSTGLKTTDRLINKSDVTPEIRNIGIKTPIEFSKNSSQQLFHLNNNPAVQIKDNLKNLILTEKGERLGMPNYGCSIKSFLFDLTSIPDYESVIINEINSQIEEYMPYLLVSNIEILDYFKPTNEEELQFRNGMAAILLRITFDIQRIKITNQKIEVVIFSGG